MFLRFPVPNHPYYDVLDSLKKKMMDLEADVGKYIKSVSSRMPHPYVYSAIISRLSDV